MKYTSVVAILDGKPDSLGEILGNDPNMPDSVSVYNSGSSPIGVAKLKRVGDTIVAEYEITINPSVVEHLYGAIAGTVGERRDNMIQTYDILYLNLTHYPTDKIHTIIGKTISFMCHIFPLRIVNKVAGIMERIGASSYLEISNKAHSDGRDVMGDLLISMGLIETEHKKYFDSLLK